jgi:geranylgeranyl transferase type-1 subunit beta
MGNKNSSSGDTNANAIGSSSSSNSGINTSKTIMINDSNKSNNCDNSNDINKSNDSNDSNKSNGSNSSSEDTSITIDPLDYDHQVSYMLKLLTRLPKQYVGLDTSRMTLVYFCIVGLDMLNHRIDDTLRQSVIDYIYAMQIPASVSDEYPGHCGFIGSPFLGQTFMTSSSSSSSKTTDRDDGNYMQGHLAMTYTALATLNTLQEGFEKVDKINIIKGLKHLQKENGVFSATIYGSECDMRFVYCACAISYMLDDWSGIDIDKVYDYIVSCITYEGGISLIPGAEAHGGSTYCATASLALINKLKDLDQVKRNNLIRWCHQRQVGGFQGRTNKDKDSCYAFWVGATLSILEAFDDTDINSTLKFILNQCQFRSGGFTKHPEGYPDILHSFYSLSYLSMAKYDKRMKQLVPSLAICIQL